MKGGEEVVESRAGTMEVEVDRGYGFNIKIKMKDEKWNTMNTRDLRLSMSNL